MKTFLPSSKNLFPKNALIRLFSLLVFWMLFCFNTVYAAGYRSAKFKGGRGAATERGINASKPPKRFVVPTFTGFTSNAVNYVAGITLSSPITPVSSGVAALTYGTSANILGTGFTTPAGVAVDKDGNLFVADYGNGAIKKIAAVGGATTVFHTGFSHPFGVAVDSTGNVFVTDASSSVLYKILKSDNSVATIGSGIINSPAGIAVDVAGNLYLADHGNSIIYKVAAGSTTPVAIGTGFYNPYGVAVDKAGNVYVADRNNKAIKKIQAAGGATVVVASGFTDPVGVSVDGVGNIYEVDNSSNTINMIPVGGGSPFAIGGGFSTPYSVAADPLTGKIYLGDFGNNAVKSIQAAGGYFITPALPTGLVFNNNTGVISGKATQTSPLTTYTVTAYNSDGGSSAMLDLHILPLSFSYSSPNFVYPEGVAVNLTPSTVGVAAPGYSSSLVSKASGFGSVRGVTTDAAGNIYITDFIGSVVKKIPVAGGSPVSIGSGFNGPDGVAVDGLGNVYVSDYNNNTIKKIPFGSNTPMTWGTGISAPYGVAADAVGNVYVADYNNHAVKKISADGSSTTVIGSGFTNPAGVAVDAAGNVFVADFGASNVKEIPVGGGAPVILGSGFSNPYGVTVDASGNVFVADYGHSALKEIPAGGSTVSLATGFNTLTGVAVGPDGILYTADYNSSSLNEIKPTGGYYIDKTLPAGLNLNKATGAISGTPTASSPATDYSVTAYSAYGSETSNVNIQVSPVTISYPASPVTYVTGVTVSPLSPTSASVAAPAFSNTPVDIGLSGLAGPNTVAFNAAGDMYVSDAGNSTVKRFPAGGGAAVTIVSSINTSGLTVDAAGNLYVIDYTNNVVKKYPFGAGPPQTVITGLNQPYGIAVDNNGNLFVADKGSGWIKEVTPGASFSSNYGSNYGPPTCVGTDAAGNVYLGSSGSNPIRMIPAGGGASVPFGNFSNVAGIVVDAAGNIYVSEQGSSAGNGAIKEILAGNGSTITLATGLTNQQGITIDTKGNLFIADYNNHSIKHLVPLGGYFINALPAGLKFDNATGIISGAPTAAIAATNYTVTAYNSLGNSSAGISITVNNPPPPVITYNSPQAYVINTTITPLSPGIQGVVPGFVYNKTPVVLSAALNRPNSITTDAAGNIYVSNTGNSAVQKIPAGGGAPVFINAGAVNPGGVAVDAAGNVYVGDFSNNVVKKIPGGTGAPIVIGAGFSGPTGVAVDAAGNVYVADFNNSAVKEILASNGSTVTIGSGFNHPNGVAVDVAGNVYVADSFNGAVKMIPAGNGTVVSLATGLLGPYGVAVDVNGNVFVAERDNDAVDEIPVGGGTRITLGSNFSSPYGVAIDASGNLYVADYFNNSAKEIKLAGGFYINPALPAGLTLNNSTGIISGKPTALSPATNYIITGFNYGGSGSTTIKIAVNQFALPAISYPSPKIYSLNAAISSLTPSILGSSGPIGAPGYSTTSTTLGTGFSLPTSVAVDTAGNIYVADRSNNQVKKILALDGSTIIIGSGFNSPAGVALDAAGNVYVGDEGSNTVQKIPVGGGAPVILASGFSSPFGVAVNTAGDVYVADEANNAIKKIPFGSTIPVMVGSGFSTPVDVKLDAAGNIYVADLGNNAIKMIPVDGGAIVTLGSGFNQPTGVAVDASGNVYVSDFQNNAIKEIPVASNTPVSISMAFNHPFAVTTDGAGNVYVADYLGSTVKKIAPVGGYYINALPAGLSFNNSTGVMTGTPTALSPATDYKVTAYNATGGGTAAINIKTISASTSALLSQLTLSAGTLSPVFASATTSYTDFVPNTAATIKLTPAVTNAGATIKINGVAVASGAASGAISLSVGTNTITTVVTATDGTTTKTYTIDITRAGPGSSNAALSIIKLTPSSSLTVVSGPATTNYTTSVPFSETSLTITPTAQDANAVIKVNGVTVASGIASAAIPLSAGANVINMLVTAPDGITTRTYQITATRAAGTPVATLSNLTLNTGALNPVFAAGTTSYTVAVPNAIASIRITPTATDANASIKVNGTTVASGALSPVLPLTVGTNTITAVVTAQDGTTTKTYTLTVNRSATGLSTNAALSIIKLTPVSTLTLTTGPATTNYTTSVPNSESSLTITPTAQDANATIKINGTTVASGAASSAIPLSAGDNIINILVTAQDGATTRSYQITATRAAGAAIATLSNLVLNTGTLNPVFAAATTSYAVAVPNTTTSIRVTPTSTDANATIKVNGTAVASGAISGVLPLTVGSNTITTVVTAQDGTTTKTYTLTVNRSAAGLSTNAALSIIKLTPASTLTLANGPATINYTTSVPYNESSLTITPTAQDANATIKVNGVTVASGTTSSSIPLSPGDNAINILVTAPDGATTRTYLITATRASGSAVATLSNLVLNTGTLNPVFAPATTGYTVTVPNTTASIRITPTVTNANATVKVNGTAVPSGTLSGVLPLSVGSNTIATVVTAQNGTTTQTYTLTVNRSAAGLSTNAALSVIKLTPASSLTVVSGPATTNYATPVPNSETSLTVTSTAQDTHATIQVNGTMVPSGTASAAIPLSVGDNVINMLVTAQDGATTRAYSITVTRAAPSMIAEYTDSPADNLKTDGIFVHRGVSPNGDGDNDMLTIDGIAAYPDNSLLIMGRRGELVFEAKGYNNTSVVFDGHSSKNGRLQQPGTYFYSLDYKAGNEIKHKTGYILLKY